LREARSHIDASSSNDASGHAVHGLSIGSSVVGTTDVQTLTNKTLTSPTITGTANIANPNITGTVTGGAQYQGITAVPAAIGSAGLIVNGLSGQTADLIDVQNNGVTSFWVNAGGTIHGKPTATGNAAAVLDMPSGTTAQIQQWKNNGVTQATMDNGGIMTANTFSNNGLTGAANSGRWVGNVMGGPPTSGTFVAGDWVNDMQLNVMWMCSTGGTPGTWTSMGVLTIGSTVLGSSQASVTFSSIPSYISFVMLKYRARSDAALAAVSIQAQLNGVTSSSYLQERNEAQNNNAVSGVIALTSSAQVGTISGGSAPANYFSSGNVEFFGWNDTTNYPTMVGTGVGPAASNNAYAGVYGSMLVAAGTNSSIKLFPSSGNFVAGSRFSLYGWS
jgi:hypothetical protein